MKTALVTGANKGIGFAVVKLLAEKGFYVYLGCRDAQRGAEAVSELNRNGLKNVEVLELDVTDQQSVDNASNILSSKIKELDVLINNAGISGAYDQTALGSQIAEFERVYATNVFGVVRVTAAFVGLLRKASQPRIVNVSTAMASLGMAGDLENLHYPKRYVIYQSSKAALNMYTVNLAHELLGTSFKINAVCPGYTQTDFTGGQGTSTTAQAAQRIVKYALIGPDGPTGKYFSEEYQAEGAYPW